MTVTVRGIRYFYEVHQDDSSLPFLALLHGFMGSGESFRHLLAPLKHFCNPVTIDLLGHGQSEGAELHYRFSAKEQTADLVKLISEQLQTPLFLYGYSMGGRLALHLALQRPDLISGLMLESTTFGIEHPQERQARQALDAARADAIAGNYQNFVKSWQEMPLFSGRNIPEDMKKRVVKIQSEQNPIWMSNSILGFGTGTMPCVKDRLHTFRNPVQLLAGADDTKFVQIMNVMLKRFPAAGLEILKDTGHRVHLEQPEAYIALIKSFIEKNKIP